MAIDTNRSKENQKINTSSYADNFNHLVDNVNSTMAALTALNELSTTDKSSVTFNLDNSDNQKTVTLPSYQSVINDLTAVKSSLNSLVTGYGNVRTLDGTDRVLTATPVPEAPTTIWSLETPTTFSVNNNWFFEDLMFPRLQVKFDLTGQIEDSADRVKVIRFIIDNSVQKNRDFYNNVILKESKKLENNVIEYNQLLDALSEHKIKYYTDEQEVQLPLVSEKYTGAFQIMDIKTIDGQTWYYLSNINYSAVSDNEQYENKVLIGKTVDKEPVFIKFNNTVYRVDEVIEADHRIRITPTVGCDLPGVEDTFTIYNEPFKIKEVGINIGFNEIDIIFIKGVNETYNLLSPQWSDGIHFVTNDLYYEGDKTQQLTNFYYRYVADFGAKWIAELKDRKIYAYDGIKPNAPVLNADFFKVTQINTQLNAALSETDIKTTTSKVESLKSTIRSLTETIALLKIDLQKSDSTEVYTQRQNQISLNTSKLKQAEAEYRSSIKYLQDQAKASGLLNVKPKYRIRGFFPIPKSQFAADNVKKLTEQKIIGFDVLYRYLKLDNTGTELKTFSYVENDIHNTGVYSDWQEYSPGLLHKVWDNDSETFIWQEESIADGSVRNINQIDIPIQRGENVEIKIRSISEAGYPENPLKSDWSNSIIIEFPTELSVESEVAALLEDSLDEQTSLQIDDALKSLGLYSHIDDSVKSNNSDDQIYYKHRLDNIAVDYKTSNGQIFSVPASILLEGILGLLFSKEPDILAPGKAEDRQKKIEQNLITRGYLKGASLPNESK